MSRHKTSGSARLWLMLVASLLVVLFVLLGWLGRSLLLGDSSDALQLVSVQPCNLHQGPCTAKYGEQTLRFHIDGPALNSEHRLRFSAQLDNIEAEQINLQLQGKNMYMGENHYVLQPDPAAADNSYQAEGQLPACTTGTMVWVALLNIPAENGMLQARFEFETL